MTCGTWRCVAGLGIGIVAGVQAAEIVEPFSADPLTSGWVTRGEASLFRWDSRADALEVTWDSSRSNSYFARPLERALGKEDDFRLTFDLRLEEIAFGTTVGKPYTFQIAVGLVDLEAASAPGFLRGTGMDSPNLVEFDYFPDSGFGATVSPTWISTNGQFASGFTFPLELTPAAQFRVELNYLAATRTMTTTMTRDGLPFGPVNDVTLGADFSNVRVDHVAVMSYSDAGQDPMFAGSVRARGWIDNLEVAYVGTPAMGFGGSLAEGRYTAVFGGTPGWRYSLQRTSDWKVWQTVAGPAEGANERQILVDEALPADRAFYRLKAERD